jgi:hypothetical protein
MSEAALELEVYEGDDRPAVYFDGNFIIYRASALFSCLAALQYARIGMTPTEPPVTMARRFRDGRIHEPHILKELEDEHGFTFAPPPIGDRQHVLSLPITRTVVVRGSPDSITTTGIIVDAKAFAARPWKEWVEKGWASFPRYAWQQSAYSLALAFEEEYEEEDDLPTICMAVKNKDTGELSVTYHEPPVSLFDIRRRVLEVEMRARQEKEPECDKRDYPCPFFYLGDACGGSKGEVEHTDDDVLEAWAANHHKVSVQQKAAKQAYDESRDRGKELVEPGAKLIVGGWKVSRSDWEQDYIDQKALKEGDPVAWERFKRQSPRTRITVEEA